MAAPDGLDTLVTAAQAAYLADVKIDTIYKWKERGLIEPTGLDEQGHNLYTIRDIARAEKQTRERARRA